MSSPIRIYFNQNTLFVTNTKCTRCVCVKYIVCFLSKECMYVHALRLRETAQKDASLIPERIVRNGSLACLPARKGYLKNGK